MGRSGGVIGTVLGAIGGALIGGPLGLGAALGLSSTAGAVAGGLMGASLGSQIGGGLAAQSFSMPTPPSPANYYYYNDEGQVTQMMVYDKDSNTYIYKTAPLTEEQKREKQLRQQIRQNILEKLKATPAEDLQRYNEYAQKFADSLRQNVQEQYEKTKQSTEEEMFKRGMMGSKAYADIMSELAKQRGEAEQEIAQRATLAKEELAQKDREFWLQTLGQLDAGVKTDTLLELQKAKQAADVVQQANAALEGQYRAQMLNALQKMQQQNVWTNLFSNLGNTAAGLMYLYGKANAGTLSSTPKLTLQSPKISGLNYLATPSGWIRY